MKTLADLKRDAASGKFSFEMVERFGKCGGKTLWKNWQIPWKMR